MGRPSSASVGVGLARSLPWLWAGGPVLSSWDSGVHVCPHSTSAAPLTAHPKRAGRQLRAFHVLVLDTAHLHVHGTLFLRVN